MVIFDALFDYFILRGGQLNVETLGQRPNEVLWIWRRLLCLDKLHNFVHSQGKGENFYQQVCSQRWRNTGQKTLKFFLSILCCLGGKHKENDFFANLCIKLYIAHSCICRVNLLLKFWLFFTKLSNNDGQDGKTVCKDDCSHDHSDATICDLDSLGWQNIVDTKEASRVIHPYPVLFGNWSCIELGRAINVVDWWDPNFL